MLWHSTLKPAKKAGLIVLFSSGLFVVICAILRCVLIVTVSQIFMRPVFRHHLTSPLTYPLFQDPVNGAQLAGSWAVRETFVAVVTTNLPMIFPLVKSLLTPVLGSLLTSMRSTNHKLDATPKDIHSNQSWRGRGPPTANPITNVTFTESEERIVDEVHMHDLKTWSESSSGNPSRENNAGNNASNIRKCVEVNVVSEQRPRRGGERREVPAEENRPSQGNYTFARGPKRTSFHAGN